MTTDIYVQPDYELPDDSILFEEVEISCEVHSYSEGEAENTNGHPDTWTPSYGCEIELTDFKWDESKYTEIENGLVAKYLEENEEDLRQEFYAIVEKDRKEERDGYEWW